MSGGLRRAIGAVRGGLVLVLLIPVHLWRATAVMRQPRCRYYPSCSTYAVDALRVHGPLRGTALASGRLLRCHPWSPGGIDHVPPRRGAADGADPSSAPQSAPPQSGPQSRPQSVAKRSVQQSGVRHA